MIVPGSTSQALAATLADRTGSALATADVERFPDGELLATVLGFTGDHAVIVAATTSTTAHVELLQLQDAVREAGAEEMVTVLPYMGYARQDEAFERGHPVSSRAIARAISTGTDRVIVVEPHEESVADAFDVPATVVHAADRLAEPLPEDLDDPAFVAPDEGAIGLAESVRDAYGYGSVDHFRKTREDGSSVSIHPAAIDVVDRDVVLIDDIVATGGTMSEAVAAVTDAATVTVACVHAILAGSARTRLERAGVDRILATDTVERPVSTVSVAPSVADAL